MSKYLKFTALSFVIAAIAGPVWADKFGLGRPALEEEISAWNWDVSPNGAGLPVGSGDAIDGEEIFAEQCAACHGDFAEGIDNWPKLAGGMDTLDREDPLKTVGSYWPHLTTAFDYVKRSMPFGSAGTLSDDDVYATVAYILYSNDLIEDDFVLSNETLLDIEMPNSDGFIIDDRAQAEYPIWTVEPCMANCKDSVKITMRATILDVTPDQNVASSNGTDVVAASAESEAASAEDADSEEASVAAYDPVLAEAGEKVFGKCKACHQVGEGAKNRSGPILTGIVGNPAGAVDGFKKYSRPMAAAADAGLVWTEEELAAFIADPRGYMKGTKMSFRGLSSDDDRLALIEFLKSFED
mgnify:FL=1